MTVIFPSIHTTNESISENKSFYERGNSVFCFSTIFLILLTLFGCGALFSFVFTLFPTFIF